MKLRTRLAPIALTAALSLGVSACGGGTDPATTTEDEMSDDEMTDEQMTDDEMTDDEMTDDEMTEDEG